MTTRRQFLAGLLASAAAPALPKISLDTEVATMTGKRDLPMFCNVVDDLYYANVNSSYGAVYTPWFDPAGLPRGVLKAGKMAHDYSAFKDDVEIGDKFVVHDMELTVEDVRRRELGYSNLFHKDADFDAALDQVARYDGAHSSKERENHAAGREAVRDPLDPDHERGTV